MTYGKCRRPANNLPFTLNDCPNSRVIIIRSATIGFYEPNWCLSWVNASCLLPTDHHEIMRCNRKQLCNFSEDVLVYPQSSAQRQCRAGADGNFVWITYNCITGNRHTRCLISFVACILLFSFVYFILFARIFIIL